MEGYEVAIRSGVMSQNECREAEKLPRSADEGTDALVVQAMPQVTIAANG